MTRLIVITSAFAIATSAAMAGDSVIHFKTKRVEAGSVLSFNCDECPPLKPDFDSPDVHGVQVSEQEIGGQNKVVQMDNMMGGSAVRIVKASAQTQNDVGKPVVTESGGTMVTEQNEYPNVVEPVQQPVVADSNVTFQGSGDFNMEEVQEGGGEQPGQVEIDDGSQTSSVNMENAEHEIVGPDEPGSEEPHDNDPEIIELRPSK